MIHNPLLRCLATTLFAACAAQCVFAIVTDRRTLTGVVNRALHIAAAVAMAVMAWPRGAQLSTTGPMVFFFAAAVWFVVIALAVPGHRITNAYYAAMMLAMSWMYAVMNAALLPALTEDAEEVGTQASTMPMAGTVMPHTIVDASPPPFVAEVSWTCVVGFAVAACWWLYVLFTRPRREFSAHHLFDVGMQATMAAGMVGMFGLIL